jgi:microcystin-dependent protein
LAVLSTVANVATPGLPVGSIQAFAGANAPTGWLLCDGSAVGRALYPDLFSTIGITYGAGNTTTTFNLPDLRGRMPLGAGTGTGLTARTLGANGGSQEIPSHQHHEGDYRAAIGAVNGNAGWLGYEANSVSSRGPSSVTNYTVFGTGFSQSSFGFNHHTRVYGTSSTPVNATSNGNMPPFLVTNYIIKAVADIARGGWYTQSSPPVVTQLPTNPALGEEVYYIDPTTGGYQHRRWDGSSWTIFNDSTFSPDSSGRVRKQYQPAFIAKTPGAYNHNSVVPASTVTLNVGNHYNNSTYRFTAPVGGIYVFIFHDIGQQNTSTYRYVLRKNGSIVSNTTAFQVRVPSNGNYGDGTGVWIQNAAVNDYFDVFYTSDAGLPSYGTLEYGYFAGYFLG